MRKLPWGRRSPIVCVLLQEDGPMVEEFMLLLWLAAGHTFRHGTSLATTAQFSSDFFWLLSQFVVV
jgi:hypothetical protein